MSRHGARSKLAFGLFLLTCAVLRAQTPTPSIGDWQQIDSGSPWWASEYSVASHPTNPLKAVAVWVYRTNASAQPRIRGAYTVNGGDDWEYTDAPIPGVPVGSSTGHGDPMTCSDSVTETLWVGGYWKNNSPPETNGAWISQFNGAGFNDAVTIISGVPGYADHTQMAMGRRMSNPSVSRMYVTYLEATTYVPRLIWSDNPAGTPPIWSGPMTIPISYPFTLRLGPNGELYIMGDDGGLDIVLIRATQEDETQETRPPILQPAIHVATRLDLPTEEGVNSNRIPGFFRNWQFVNFAVAPGGVLYCVYDDTTKKLVPPPPLPPYYDIDIFLTKSTQNGDAGSWSAPKVVNSGDGYPYDQFFPWIEADSAGNLHMTYYDTNVGVSHLDDDPEARLWLRYWYSVDGATTWTITTLAPRGPGAPPYFTDGFKGFIGDYNGLAVTYPRVYPAYMATQAPSGDVPQHAYSNVIIWP